jgi:hypothetical protein
MIKTSIELALRGVGWGPGRTGQGASPISQDSAMEGLAWAYEHGQGVLPEEFVHYLFESSASKCGSPELRQLAIMLGMLNWW